MAPGMFAARPHPGPRRVPAEPLNVSEHRNRADPSGLQLKHHGLDNPQRYQPGLLDSPVLAPEVQGETGGSSGLSSAGMHQDHHAAVGSAGGVLADPRAAYRCYLRLWWC
jgi:hypothetical protein